MATDEKVKDFEYPPAPSVVLAKTYKGYMGSGSLMSDVMTSLAKFGIESGKKPKELTGDIKITITYEKKKGD